MTYYLKMFAVSLLLTLLIEHVVAFLLGERGKRTVLLVTLVNVLTNPLAVYCYLLGGRLFPRLSLLRLQLPIEAAVLLAEALIYRAFSVKKGDVIRRPVLLALLCNAVSYGAGLLIHFFA